MPRSSAPCVWPDALTAALRDHVAAAGGQLVPVRPGAAFGSGPDGLVVRPGSAEDLTAALVDLAARGLTPDRVVHLWTAEPSPGPAEGAPGALMLGMHTLIALAKAAGDLGLAPWTLDIVTRGAQRMLPGDPLRAELATLFGPLRLIPVEYPGVRTRLIDIGIGAGPRTGEHVLAELTSEPSDQVVALRGGKRWIPGYEVLDPEVLDLESQPGPGRVRIRRGGSYLITGGLGGIGLAMAERLVLHYQARLVLMGRTPVPPR